MKIPDGAFKDMNKLGTQCVMTCCVPFYVLLPILNSSAFMSIV